MAAEGETRQGPVVDSNDDEDGGNAEVASLLPREHEPESEEIRAEQAAVLVRQPTSDKRHAEGTLSLAAPAADHPCHSAASWSTVE